MEVFEGRLQKKPEASGPSTGRCSIVEWWRHTGMNRKGSNKERIEIGAWSIAGLFGKKNNLKNNYFHYTYTVPISTLHWYRWVHLYSSKSTAASYTQNLHLSEVVRLFLWRLVKSINWLEAIEDLNS